MSGKYDELHVMQIEKSGTYYSSAFAHKTQINHQNEILSWNFSISVHFFRVSSGISSALWFTFCLQVYFMAYRAQPNSHQPNAHVCEWCGRVSHITILLLLCTWMFVISSGVSSLVSRYHLHKSRTYLHQWWSRRTNVRIKFYFFFYRSLAGLDVERWPFIWTPQLSLASAICI